MNQTRNTKQNISRTLGMMFEDDRLKTLARAGAFMLGFLTGIEAATAAITPLYDRLGSSLPEVSSTALNPLELVGEMMGTMLLNPMELLAVMSLYLLVFLSGILVLFFVLVADSILLVFWETGQATFSEGETDG